MDESGDMWIKGGSYHPMDSSLKRIVFFVVNEIIEHLKKKCGIIPDITINFTFITITHKLHDTVYKVDKDITHDSRTSINEYNSLYLRCRGPNEDFQ